MADEARDDSTDYCGQHQGKYDEATLLFEKCLTLSREFDDQYNTALQLNNLGTEEKVMEIAGDIPQIDANGGA